MGLVADSSSGSTLDVSTLKVVSEKIFDANLSSATQDTNDATKIFTWGSSSTNHADATHTLNDSKVLLKRGEHNVSCRIHVEDATANDRASWILEVLSYYANGTLYETYPVSSSVYIRDDSSLYDEGSGGGTIPVMIPDDNGYIEIKSTRLTSQDAADDNLAHQTQSFLKIEKKRLEV